MDTIVSALKTGLVWGVALGGIVLAVILARIIVSPIYENSRKKGQIDVIPLLILIGLPGLVLTFLLFSERPADLIVLGLTLAFTVIGIVLLLVQSKKKSYNKARNACAVASWFSIFFGAIIVIFVSYLLKFDQQMVLVASILAVAIPSLLYSIVGRETA